MPGTRDQQRWSMKKGVGLNVCFRLRKRAGCQTRQQLLQRDPVSRISFLSAEGPLGSFSADFAENDGDTRGVERVGKVTDRGTNQFPWKKRISSAEYPAVPPHQRVLPAFFLFLFFSYANETFGCFLNYLREFSDFNFISFSFSLWKSFEPSFRL